MTDNNLNNAATEVKKLQRELDLKQEELKKFQIEEQKKIKATKMQEERARNKRIDEFSKNVGFYRQLLENEIERYEAFRRGRYVPLTIFGPRQPKNYPAKSGAFSGDYNASTGDLPLLVIIDTLREQFEERISEIEKKLEK